MVYENINPGDSLSDSLNKIKARDDALRGWEFSATAPSNPVAYQVWVDTANNKIKRRNAANNAWIDKTSLLDAVFDNYIDRNGGNSMNAIFNAGGFRVANVADPTNAQDAVTRQHFDDNTPLRFRFCAAGIRSAGTPDRMEWNSVIENTGFNLQNNDTEIVVNNTGLYRVDFAAFKAVSQGIRASFRRLVPGPETEQFAIEDISTDVRVLGSHARYVSMTSGDVYILKDTGGFNGFETADNALQSIILERIRA